MPTPSSGIHYRIEPATRHTPLHSHLFRVTLSIAAPKRGQKLSLPVWIPGSYLVREFSKNLQGLQARQGGTALVVQQMDKHRWKLACVPGQPVEVEYDIYALDNSVRTAWLDAARGFFNGTSLCLRVEGQTDAPHTLELPRKAWPAGWQVATGLAAFKTDRAGFGLYRAADYDELADCPVELGEFWVGSFKAGGVPHRLVVSGAPPSFDGEKLLTDTQKICETQIRFWHGSGKTASKPPFDRYTFLLNTVDDGYGGLEHRNSTALICNRRDLPRLGPRQAVRPSDGYATLLGLISHEYFHTWNVKRLRPAEFARYDYAAENHTQLLWFFEGFTSYYDDLLLRRAGLIDDAAYLKLLNKTVNQVLQTPGRHVQSVAQASFDAWVKYYRPDDNTPNTTVSYYTKGALVALCLDLTLRQNGRISLDDLMRSLWQRCKGGNLKEKDLKSVLGSHKQLLIWEQLQTWVHGTGDLPLQELLTSAGVTVSQEADAPAQALGLRVVEGGGTLTVKTVLRGGLAEQAGLASGDEWLAMTVDGAGTATASTWRVRKMEDVLFYAGAAAQVTALVARDQQVLWLPLRLPAREAGQASATWQLKPARSNDSEARLAQWLGAP